MNEVALPFRNKIEELIEKERYIQKLPRKKRLLAELYPIYMDINKVAKMMNVKPSSVYRMLKDEAVQTGIKYMQDIISIRNNITQDYFVEKLKEIVEGDAKVADRINALQLLAKITGFIKDRPDLAQQQVIVVKPEGLLDGE